MQMMAATLRFEQHREAGVLGDLDGPDGVHDHGHVQRHEFFREVESCALAYQGRRDNVQGVTETAAK